MSSPTILSGLPPEALEELKQLLTEKASDLFALCDQEEKGFVTKRDMQRMRGEMALDPEQLEAVFDRLDVDNNGFLTLEEFTDGFGEYLGIQCVEAKEEQEAIPQQKQQHTMEAGPNARELDEEDDFNVMLSELGILGLIEDDRALRDMWLNLRQENDPTLVANFEEFLAKLSKDLNKRTTEHENFENAVKSRTLVQEEHLQRLYEEMEQQIGAERQRVRQEEERREQRLREELEATMAMKDQQLMEVMERMRGLHDQLEDAKKSVPNMKEENSHLARERDRLQQEVERQRILQRELQENMETLRSHTQSERRERAKAALKVSENIAQEREGLVHQLDFMKALNTKMLDDRDLCLVGGEEKNAKGEVRLASELRMMDGGEATRKDDARSSDEKTFDLATAAAGRPGSNVAGRQQQQHLRPSSQNYPTDLAATSECEYDDDYFENNSPVFAAIPGSTGSGRRSRPGFRRFHSHPSSHDQHPDNVSLHEELAFLDSGRGSGGSLANLPLNHDGHSSRSSLDEDPDASGHRHSYGGSNNCHYSSSLLIYNLQQRQRQQLEASQQQHDSLTSGPVSNGDSDLTSFNTRSSGMGQDNHYIHPLSQASRHGTMHPYEPVRMPERVFKVIFIGDSSVGKSSLITRFCTGKFQPGIRSTIGMDFHTRSILVEDQSVCLQCWDTAGQERYRAITQQYFRKADAVIVVYDITSEKSFLNAREWLDNAVDGAGEEASLLLLGNKLDMAQDDLFRKVRKTEGLSLSRQYSTLFGEVSAADGSGVEPTLMELAKLLREREDLDMQKALKLSLEKTGKKNKSCCGKD